ncbi:MAG: CehA/McbA family metallohydrolase [Verrucomicrobia bacterium]|nr:CehA/McbA family metallohydrolase [Verrucomicrobiota bacterium]
MKKLLVLLAVFLVSQFSRAAVLPLVTGVDAQPFFAQVQRLIEATDYLGSPFSAADKAALQAAMKPHDADAVRRAQEILDAHCLYSVNINPEMRVKVAAGPAKPELVEQGWRQFLVKVHNEAGTTAALLAVSPNALAVSDVRQAQTASDKFFSRQKKDFSDAAIRNRWLDLQTFDKQPLKPALSGLALEYRILQLYSRDAGQREARISFNVGQGTQDIGFRNDADILFRSLPAQEITLRVKDENGKPATAAFLIRDAAGRVHPSQAKRLAPDFAFHPQVYRADGEKLRLPAGSYTVEFQRGPESIAQTRAVTVDKKTRQLEFKVVRWIDPALFGWWSGDHHIHAAGCAHYNNPTEGVHAPDMARHCQGEDLKIGANLTWGPCFDYQKQFFTGKDDKVSTYPYLLRYDIEVSGFGSHKSGHLCLLRLKDQMYPGGESKDHWPTLCLNTLRWAKAQGAVVGPAHSGWGLQPAAEANRRDVAGSKNSSDLRMAAVTLPNYVIPPFNGIGANEYIMNVTHEVPGPDGKLVPAVDFISTVDTPYLWELNIWYHTLNTGFRTRISGETDFPCIYGERVGLGRSYVKLDGKLNYDDWCEGIRNGRNYVGDGKSHLMDFKVNSVAVGEHGSELKLDSAGAVKISARVAARLNEQPDPAMRNLSPSQKPYWDVERARVGDTREVPVELLVNGQSVARKNIVADGALRDISFDTKIERSSWVALRILPSSHTNPIWVMVGGQPVRASRRSAEWCLKSVDQCWSEKEKLIAQNELAGARQDYEHARQTYRRILAESDVE